jgi:hypothetical protein
MAQKTISVTAGEFRNPLIPAAATVYTLSALLGLIGVALLFDPEYAAILAQDRIDGGVQLRSALQLWYRIDSSITVLGFLCPAVMAAGLWAVLRGRFAAGMRTLTRLFQGLLWCLYGSSILTLGCYLFAMIRSIVFYLPYNEGVYYVYSLLITEGLMGVQAWLIWLVLRKFLRDSIDCTFSITYTLTSGKLDSMSLPSFPALGLVILGCVQLVLGCNCMFTIVLVENYVGNYYRLLIAAHPGQYLAAATLFSGAIGNFLLSGCLRRYNRICERIRFRNSGIGGGISRGNE